MSTNEETRRRMLTYWQGYCEPSVEMMMLDSDAASINERETGEILGMIPSPDGLDVIELGCGIGRFTQPLAAVARTVDASDFMPAFVVKNRELNGHFPNLRLEVADATQMVRTPASADLVFTNWLFMYLNDSEVRSLFARVLDWLRPGGHFFFRESCFHKSGSVTTAAENPTEYRSPQRYYELLLEAGHSGSRFAVTYARPSRTYLHMKGNRNQICWLARKAPLVPPHELGTLGKSQCLLTEASVAGLLQWGKEGEDEDGGLLEQQLDVKPGEVVLDVGCGLGETARLLARKFGAHVTGVEISGPLFSLALQRANQSGVRNVIFESADIETYDMYESASFDVIYCRGVLRGITDKVGVLAKLYNWLKPGGRLSLTDCGHQGEKPAAANVDSCLTLLQQAGFVELAVNDVTARFEAEALANCQTLNQNRQLFVQHFGEFRFEQARTHWESRLAMCQSCRPAWILYRVIKRED